MNQEVKNNDSFVTFDYSGESNLGWKNNKTVRLMFK